MDYITITVLCRETHQPGMTRSMIDIYLDQMEKSKEDPESSFNGMSDIQPSNHSRRVDEFVTKW